jgi:hypothetical protein
MRTQKFHLAETYQIFSKFLIDFNNFSPKFSPFLQKQIVSTNAYRVPVKRLCSNNKVNDNRLFRKGKLLPYFSQNSALRNHAMCER